MEYDIDVSPKAVIADSIRRDGGAWDLSWSSGAHASREMDGTINNPKNRDEEWAIELAIPFESLGMKGERGETIGLSLSRCDTLKGAPEICAGWARLGRIGRGNDRAGVSPPARGREGGKGPRRYAASSHTQRFSIVTTRRPRQ